MLNHENCITKNYKRHEEIITFCGIVGFGDDGKGSAIVESRQVSG
jgi:hypothetical protein